MVETLAKRAREIRTSKDPRPKKIEKLRSFINDSKNGLINIPPLPLPLNARIEITGINAEKSSVFKSNQFPFLLYFQCVDGSEYPAMFKDGDDMRQDQLVLQLFTLMDQLLRKENLDLKLIPYDVLATGPLQGMAQFIPSKTIAAIVSEHGTLLNYLRASHPDEGSVGTYGVEPSVIDTFVRSCGMCILAAWSENSHLPSCVAGYCVVTYLLGVGDRHLDNLLLTPDGPFSLYSWLYSRACSSFTTLRAFLPWYYPGLASCNTPLISICSQSTSVISWAVIPSHFRLP